MSYLVLARKWRPRTFETLIGQDHVVKALSNALNTGRLHHAWLFTGTRGVGKTTLARILAKSLNCMNNGISAHPCGTCQACVEIDEGRFVDYLEFDAASNRRVEEMTQLLEQAIYSPSVGRFKIYTIDEVHMLSGHAFNAMLKSLEEPPPHVKFILATTDPQKIPVTVLSRCLQFNLKQMAPESIVYHLQNVLTQENVAYESEGLRLLAQAAAGSMRDALSLTDQAIAYSASSISADAVRDMLGTIDQCYLLRLIAELLQGSAQGVRDIADELSVRGYSFSGALSDLSGLLSRLAVEQRLPGSISAEDPSYIEMMSLVQSAHPDTLQLFYSIALHSRAELALAPDEYTGFMMAGLRMLSLVSQPQAQDLQNNVPTAEKKSSERIASEALTPVASRVTSGSSDTSLAETAPTVASDSVLVPLPNVQRPVTEPDAHRMTEPRVAYSNTVVAEMAAVPIEEPPPEANGLAPTPMQISSLEMDEIPPWEDIPMQSMVVVPMDSDDDVLVEDIDQSWLPSHNESEKFRLEQMNSELWVKLVQALNLSGLIGELARNSEWLGLLGNTIRLRMLMRISTNLQARNTLSTLLTEYFGCIVKVDFEFGQTGQATLHSLELQQQRERLELAQQQVAEHPLIREIIAEFNAKVIPDSIKPL